MPDQLVRLCFLVCDSGPAEHFAAFAQGLSTDDKLCIDIYADELIRSKFRDLTHRERIRLFHFSLDGLNNDDQDHLARTILEDCVQNGNQTIIVDIANEFDLKLRESFDRLHLLSTNIDFWCYYDNSESYVPGGYSIRADEMIKVSKNILFANKNLSRIGSTACLHEKSIAGIGYYPIQIAERLAQRRTLEREQLREKYGWKNMKYIFVYFGGNNRVYYEQAFPHCLSLLSQISDPSLNDTLFLLHQHPGAKKENYDAQLFQKCLLENACIQGVVSSLTSDEAQILADAILYYQTSMTPQFALIGLPIMQISHEIYQDILVRYDLCHIATNSDQLKTGLEILKNQKPVANSAEKRQIICNAIGYDANWLENFRNSVLK